MSEGKEKDLLDKEVEMPSCAGSYATTDRSMEPEKGDYIVEVANHFCGDCDLVS